jgi:hypothetical protein
MRVVVAEGHGGEERERKERNYRNKENGWFFG